MDEEYITDIESHKSGLKEKFINFLDGRYFIPAAIVLIAVIAFSLGRVSGLEEKREPVRVINNSLASSSLISSETRSTSSETRSTTREGSSERINSGEVKGASTNSSGSIVASKNGTKYHYPWCAGAKQISEKNKIFFDSIESARAAGYTPASNCKGLK